MAADLIWRKRAENHLQSIFDYISADNVGAAEAYVEAIVAACDRLRSFPLSGRAFDKRHRVLVVRNHLVLYRYQWQNAKVIIAAVVDGRRMSLCSCAAWAKNRKREPPYWKSNPDSRPPFSRCAQKC